MSQQINLSYDPEQDRLLLRVREKDDREYRVWLTRRFTGLLCKVLQESMERLGGHHRLAASEEAVSRLKAGVFAEPYAAPSRPALPLGEKGILAYRLNYHGDTTEPVVLQLLPRDGQGLNLNLGRHMLYLFYNLLEQSLGQTGWDLQETAATRQLLH